MVKTVGLTSETHHSLPSSSTPFGVGLGLDPPTYLKRWDVVTLGIDKLGVSS
jgi:hypothetical protein